MYSTAPGNLTDDAARGAFVSELIKQIRAPRLTVEEAFDRTRMEVSRATQGGQVPWFMSLISEDFSFDSKSAVVAANQPSAVPQAKLARPEENNPAVSPPSKLATAGPPQVALPAPSKPNVPQDGKPSVQPDAKPVVNETAKTPTQPPPPAPATPDATKSTSTPEIKPLPVTKPAAVEAGKPPTEVPIARLDPKPDPPKPQAPISNAAKSPQAPDPPAVVAPVENAAIAHLNARLQHDPNDANAFYRRGQLYAKNGVFSRAADDFDAAIRLNPKDPEAFNNRCWVRAMVADPKTALAGLRRGASAAPWFRRCARQPRARAPETQHEPERYRGL